MGHVDGDDMGGEVVNAAVDVEPPRQDNEEEAEGGLFPATSKLSDLEMLINSNAALRGF